MTVNRLGADWVEIRRWLMIEIENARSRLETAMPPEDTAAERGLVRGYRKLIEFVEPRPTEQFEKEDPYGA